MRLNDFTNPIEHLKRSFWPEPNKDLFNPRFIAITNYNKHQRRRRRRLPNSISTIQYPSRPRRPPESSKYAGNMTYNGRRAPNVSEYIANLNAIPSAQDLQSSNQEPFSADDDLAMFTNTQFFDFDLGHEPDFQNTDLDGGHGGQSVADSVDMKSMDFNIPGKRAGLSFSTCCVVMAPWLPGGWDFLCLLLCSAFHYYYGFSYRAFWVGRNKTLLRGYLSPPACLSQTLLLPLWCISHPMRLLYRD